MLEPNNLNLPDIPDEQTEEFISLDEGNYFGIVGRIFADETKSGFKRKVIEVINLQKTPLNSTANSKPTLLTDFKSEGQNIRVSLRKDKSGTPLISGVLFPISFLDMYEGMSQGARNFNNYQKRRFARQFLALDEQTGVISWKKISASIGKGVTFQLTKRKDSNYMNVDFDTFAVLDVRAPIEDVQKIYEMIQRVESGADDINLPF